MVNENSFSPIFSIVEMCRIILTTYPQFVDKLLINISIVPNVKGLLNFSCGYHIDKSKLFTKFVDNYVNSVDKKEFFAVFAPYIL